MSSIWYLDDGLHMMSAFGACLMYSSTKEMINALWQCWRKKDLIKTTKFQEIEPLLFLPLLVLIDCFNLWFTSFLNRFIQA